LLVSVISHQTNLCVALQHVLGQEPELGILSAAPEGNDWLAHADEARPDLLLLDWDLPNLQASALLCALGENGSSPKVVAFSQRREAQREALDAGAAAFVCREDPIEYLLFTLLQIGGLSPVLVD
jgi:DNA-binding NarL/FixJ family response regulator